MAEAAEAAEHLAETQLPVLNSLKLSEDYTLSTSTRAIHADDALNGPEVTDVAPALHVSTTFRYTNDLDKLVPAADKDVRVLD
jgi:hypothetical protein